MSIWRPAATGPSLRMHVVIAGTGVLSWSHASAPAAVQVLVHGGGGRGFAPAATSCRLPRPSSPSRSFSRARGNQREDNMGRIMKIAAKSHGLHVGKNSLEKWLLQYFAAC